MQLAAFAISSLNAPHALLTSKPLTFSRDVEHASSKGGVVNDLAKSGYLSTTRKPYA
jgi:hypothetical protein